MSLPLAQAFESLRQHVSPADGIAFQSTKLEDVWAAARVIEAQQKERRSLQNLRRITPFLDALEKYSKTIEVLCNGTPFLPWIWAPIKFMLQRASEYTNAFEKLVSAYAQIAEAMPRFDRFQQTFSNNPYFQNVLALVFADIVEFHQHAYTFFCRRGWRIFFDSLWKDFGARFRGILESLARHRDLVDKEASSIEIEEAKHWRARAQDELEGNEKRRRVLQLQDTITWLAVDDRLQEDHLDRLSLQRQPGTCNWILQNELLTAWLAKNEDGPILWLKGMPGAGKTILCSHIISSVRDAGKESPIYYFCNSNHQSQERCSQALRALVLQLVRAHMDLAPHVCEQYVQQGLTPSLAQLRRLLPELLEAVPSTHIIVDGLDEWPEKDQKTMITELQALLKASKGSFKLLISSREDPLLGRAFGSKPNIALNDNEADTNADIRLYVAEMLADLRHTFDGHIIDEIEQVVVAKAHGMFLYVKLVVTELQNRFSVKDLQSAANSLPEGLNGAYGRILNRIQNEYKEYSRHRAFQILEWMAYAFRPLKTYEIQDGMVFEESNSLLTENTRLPKSIFELCKPMIEEGPANTVNFVHFSAKEYIMNRMSGPFLQEDKAHGNIALSCISYLQTALIFVSPSISDEERQIQVVKGFHSLYLYASEFWVDHLIRYGDLCASRGIFWSRTFQERLLGFLPYSKEEEPAGLKTEMTRSKLANGLLQLLAFNDTPEMQRLVGNVLAFRKILAREMQSTTKPDELHIYQLEHDPTLFTEASNCYQEMVKYLLCCPPSSTPRHLDPAALSQFKEIFGDSTFGCRYYQCPRSSEGFDSTEERDRHESLHAKRLRCPDSKCEFYSSGFASKSALLKHNRKYHDSSIDFEVPLALRAKKAEVTGFPVIYGSAGNHALQDYQTQLMLFEQRRKERLRKGY